LATTPAELLRGNLNQRLNIWSEGWHAFAQAPIFGTGAGSFAQAAHLAQISTAHNTVLAIAASGGLVALFLATVIFFMAAHSISKTRGALRLALATALSVWAVASLAATVLESRKTWLLLGVIAVAGRFAAEEPERLDACFPPEPDSRRDSGYDSGSESRPAVAAGVLVPLPE
ncbi:MAG: O-antigen ligase family protein, partial [Terracidiphilus sp.]